MISKAGPAGGSRLRRYAGFRRPRGGPRNRYSSNSQRGFSHAGRYIAPAVENSPDVNVFVAFDVEHKIGKALHFPAAQSGNGKFLRVARRPEARMAGDRPISGLKRLDETERDVGARLADVVVDGRFDIPMGQLAREDRLPVTSP